MAAPTPPPAASSGTSFSAELASMKAEFAKAAVDGMKVTKAQVKGNAILDAAKARPQG